MTRDRSAASPGTELAARLERRFRLLGKRIYLPSMRSVVLTVEAHASLTMIRDRLVATLDDVFRDICSPSKRETRA